MYLVESVPARPQRLAGGRRESRRRLAASHLFVPALAALACQFGCRSPASYRTAADQAVDRAVRTAQRQALGRIESVEFETPADTLRRRLLLDQNLPHSDPASLGLHDLPPSEYLDPGKHLPRPSAAAGVPVPALPPAVRMIDALRIGAGNSREYQKAKEDLFRAALALDLERHEFRRTFSAMLSGHGDRDATDPDAVESVRSTADLGLSRALRSGVDITSRIAVDLVKLLTQEAGSSFGIVADASISIPLLRGAGARIAGAALKQAEQNMLYAVYTFERFKRSFAVQIAADYLGVLRQRQQLHNVEENYKRLIASARRARGLADAGRLPEFQLDQAVQDELRARTRWIEAQQAYAKRLDGFKVALGLPPDAALELETAELDRLHQITNRLSRVAADAEPAAAGIPRAGPLEMDARAAVLIAIESRLDLRVAAGRVEDARRRVYVAADSLRTEVTLLGNAQTGERRTSAAGAGLPDAELRPDRGTYAGVLTFDLPLERTAECHAYRNSLIDLGAAVRDLQELEDAVKLQVVNDLRDLHEAREGLRTQLQAVALADKRVRSTDLFLQAGRAQIRDVLEAQEALLGAQNALTAAAETCRIAELALQRDMGVLQVSADGIWTEYAPGERIR